MRGPYPLADGEEGRGPGGMGNDDGERRGGGFQRKGGVDSMLKC
jgi:hypothetical protein